MKKAVVVAVMLLGAFFALSFPAFASGEADFDTGEKVLFSEYIDTFYADAVSGSGVEIDSEKIVDSVGIGAFLKTAREVLREKKSGFLSFFIKVFGFAVLSAACELSSISGGVKRTAEAVVISVMAGTVYPELHSLFSSVRDSLVSVCDFFGAAMPTLTAVTCAQGAVQSAAAQAMNMNIVLGFIGTALIKVLLPLSFSMLSLAMISSFCEGSLQTVSKAIKNFFTFGLGAVSAVASAVISLQSIVANAADSAALRAARYASSSLIPVVGASVSAAISTIAGGLAYVKSAIGGAAILVTVLLTIAPLVSLLLYRLAFSISVFFLEFVDISGGVRCFSAFRSAIDAVISVYVMSTLVCIIQLILFMRSIAL